VIIAIRSIRIDGFKRQLPGDAREILQGERAALTDGASSKCPVFVGRGGLRGAILRAESSPNARVQPDFRETQECPAGACLPQCYGGYRFLNILRMAGLMAWSAENPALPKVAVAPG
jgi:hypothetical protein